MISPPEITKKIVLALFTPSQTFRRQCFPLPCVRSFSAAAGYNNIIKLCPTQKDHSGAHGCYFFLITPSPRHLTSKNMNPPPPPKKTRGSLQCPVRGRRYHFLSPNCRGKEVGCRLFVWINVQFILVFLGSIGSGGRIVFSSGNGGGWHHTGGAGEVVGGKVCWVGGREGRGEVGAEEGNLTYGEPVC